MSGVAIRVEGLGKSYTIAHQRERERPNTFRESIVGSVKRMASVWRDRLALKDPGAAGLDTEEFWALRDVGFEVGHGEVVGIVGRNGAGKSTLLKILSRITEPTTGRVTIDGRVASLLEVGTGFHPELTGRENIYLNGAVLGMTRAEIRRKFDEIVDFAEIERFLDTPVKRYSSGMYVRLAFAVAAHLEPEILIVDEVLAVGDAEFQKKCLGKMQNVSATGRTVLVVSHSISTIRRLCTRGVLLEGGRVKEIGDVERVIQKYMSRAETHVTERWDYDPKYENEYITPLGMAWDGDAIRLRLRTGRTARNLTASLRITNDNGEVLFETTSRDLVGDPFAVGGGGERVVRVRMPTSVMKPGPYKADFFVHLHMERYIIAPDDAPSIYFEVAPAENAGELLYEKRGCLIAPAIRWETGAAEGDRDRLTA